MPSFSTSGKLSNITTSLRLAQEVCEERCFFTSDFKSPKNLLRFCQTRMLYTFPWLGCIHLTGAGETGAVHCERKQSPRSQRNITARLAVLWEDCTVGGILVLLPYILHPTQLWSFGHSKDLGPQPIRVDGHTAIFYYFSGFKKQNTSLIVT